MNKAAKHAAGLHPAVQELAAFGGSRAVGPGAVTRWPAPADGDLAALRTVIDSGRFHRVNHPAVVAAEDALAEWCGLHTRAVASGTAAIHIALSHFKNLSRPRVVTASLNWPGAVAPIHVLGLLPHYVDVSAVDACLDEERACAALDDSVGAILITHLFGNVAKLARLRNLARARGIAIIDDAAQAISVAKACGQGLIDTDAVMLSGNGSKHLGAGELGFVCSRSQAVLEHVDRVSLSSSARDGGRIFSPFTQGFNYRPSPFSAAIAHARVEQLDDQLAARRANVRAVHHATCALQGLRTLYTEDNEFNSFCSMALACKLKTGITGKPVGRDIVVSLLQAEGVPAGVWMRKPVWEYLAWGDSEHRLSSFPTTQQLLEEMFYLPEVAPPNGLSVMGAYGHALCKVWHALPYLTDEYTQRVI